LVPHARQFGLFNIPLGILVISDGQLHIGLVGFWTQIQYLVHQGKCIKKHSSTAGGRVVVTASAVVAVVVVVVVAAVAAAV
jgi:hypothetical protein